MKICVRTLVNFAYKGFLIKFNFGKIIIDKIIIEKSFFDESIFKDEIKFETLSLKNNKYSIFNINIFKDKELALWPRRSRVASSQSWFDPHVRRKLFTIS